MPLLSPPQLPARFGIARFGASRFGYLYSVGCAVWVRVTAVLRTWTVDPACE